MHNIPYSAFAIMTTRSCVRPLAAPGTLDRSVFKIRSKHTARIVSHSDSQSIHSWNSARRIDVSMYPRSSGVEVIYRMKQSCGANLRLRQRHAARVRAPCYHLRLRQGPKLPHVDLLNIIRWKTSDAYCRSREAVRSCTETKGKICYF